MKTVIATDTPLFLHDGKYYYGVQVSTILKRYYSQFGKLSICCRVKKLNNVDASYEDVTDMIDSVVMLPSLKRALFGVFNSEVRNVIKNCDFLICRCPGIISYCAADLARHYNKKYFTEIMGCAWDAYWNHSTIGKIVAPFAYIRMKRTVQKADYALYVTNEFLQKRYPCKNKSVGVSDVVIKNLDESIIQHRIKKIENTRLDSLTLITTAAIDVRYKGQEYVIKAIPKLNKHGIRIRYLLVGGGDQSYLKQIAQKYGVQNQVEFLGRQSMDEVMKNLDFADIYIQPSLTEGLPRAVVEAMSRGCPVIGTKSGGIPELIAEECIVNRKSEKEIYEKIVFIANHEKMKVIAKKNFDFTKEWKEEILDKKRDEYYKQMKCGCTLSTKEM